LITKLNVKQIDLKNIYLYGCGAEWSWITQQNLNEQTFETIKEVGNQRAIIQKLP